MADDDVAVYGHLAALDADGDGEISRDEYRKAHATDRDQGLKAKAPKMLKAREMYKPEGKTFKGKFDKKFASKRASGGKKKKKRR